ncbi:MAG: glycosyl hydrolase [Acidobacteriota bacterium]
MLGLKKFAVATGVLLIFLVSGLGRSASDPMEEGFVNPPDEARPRVWWHWTGGNVTKEGITKDLEWMKRVGIGGAQIADIGMEGGQVIENKILFFTPEWFDAVRHAAAEADRLGLELTIFSSSGWSLTGGPWVKPEQAMKKLVWSETRVRGGSMLNQALPQPPSDYGAQANLRRVSGKAPSGNYYRDSVVLAFPTPSDETLMEDLKPEVSASSGEINSDFLMDSSADTGVTVNAGSDGIAWIQYEFSEPVIAKAVTLIAQGRGIPFGQIQASDDGVSFRTIVELPGAVQYRAGGFKTYAFPETSTRFIRVTMTGTAPDPDAVINQTKPKPAEKYQISEFVSHSGARVDLWQEKAGFNLIYDYESVPTPPVQPESLIRSSDIVDLTSNMDGNGVLKWEAPSGNWTILRMGYALVGSRNRAGTPAGEGLEVDKLNAKHVTSYFHGYMDPIEEALGPLVGKSLRYMMMDSWEAGSQNWTNDMIAQFRKKRGYDPIPWLPVLTGRVVGSSDDSDRFLWDFRRTIVDLIAEAHYGTMADLLREKGMGLYAEAPGVSMEILEDTLLTKSKVDIPMGEFWLGRMHPPPEYYVDVRMAASTAHVYGKKFVATESFTGGGYDTPATYKNLADYWFAQGVNRLVFHSSAHQPLDTKPGNTMVGTHFNRNITWSEQAGSVLDYFSRTSYMLQQGLFVADLAYLLKEGAPSSQPFWGAGLQPAPPGGYDYDTINADVLLNRMTVTEDGRLVLPDGMSYRVLVLPQMDRIRPALLRKIRDLVSDGAILAGPKPVMSPSLQGGASKADLEVQALANEIWGDLDGIQRNKHFYGKGLVTWGLPLEEVLALADIPEDAEFAGPLDSSIVWLHRRSGDADIYFVANRTDSPADIQSRFRVKGKRAELWHPDTGTIGPAGYSITGERTEVPLHLDPRESVFVVFRSPAQTPSRAVIQTTETILTTLNGPWNIGFPRNLGAPEHIQLAELESWTENADDGVKYFSGTATYTKTIQVPGDWLDSEARIILDLGTVKDIAQVFVNGKPAGTLWKPPYRSDISGLLKPGENILEIKVTNQWTNRQIGDGKVDPELKVFSSMPSWMDRFGPPKILADSGLIGPVAIISLRSEK